MQRKSTITLSLAVLAVAVAGGGCNKLRARDQLNKGVEAYSSGQYDQAIEHFKSAEEYDPTLTNAQLYLAAAYQAQYIPGAPSPDNLRNGEEAEKINQAILAKDPNNLSAIDNLGSLYYNMAQTPFDEQGMIKARSFHEKHIELSPNDAQPYYWVGVIDFWISHHANQELRDEYNRSGKKPIKDTDPLPKEEAAKFAQDYGQTVDDGIAALNKAIELNPNYDDAMGYLSLLDRQKGDMEETADAREADNKAADALMDKAKAIKQQREASAANSGTSS
ncbi:MAG TPA: tetratricopeptide repeat protein [Candidatus Aquilonibacter sp.]|nr:tetratricopeptide repeat protein [Candidatus Aquilonibacter sp.]